MDCLVSGKCKVQHQILKWLVKLKDIWKQKINTQRRNENSLDETAVVTTIAITSMMVATVVCCVFQWKEKRIALANNIRYTNLSIKYMSKRSMHRSQIWFFDIRMHTEIGSVTLLYRLWQTLNHSIYWWLLYYTRAFIFLAVVFLSYFVWIHLFLFVFVNVCVKISQTFCRAEMIQAIIELLFCFFSFAAIYRWISLFAVGFR